MVMCLLTASLEIKLKEVETSFLYPVQRLLLDCEFKECVQIRIDFHVHYSVKCSFFSDALWRAEMSQTNRAAHCERVDI